MKMERQQIRKGTTYIHTLEGREWRVIVKRFDNDSPDEWYGVLAKAQGGLEAGANCWGKVSELRVE